MEDKLKPITIVNLVIMAIVFVLVLIGIGDTTIKLVNARGTGYWLGYLLRLAVSVICDVGLVLSGIYLIMDQGKQAAKFYKAELCIIGIVVLMQIVLMYVPVNPNTHHEALALKIAMIALTFIGLLVLAFAKDLGRTRTCVIFFIVLAIYCAFNVMTILNGPFIFSKTCNHVAQALLLLSFGFMIQGKYADKAARGRKV